MTDTHTQELHRKVAALVVGEYNADSAHALGLVVGSGMGRNGMVASIIRAACARAPRTKTLTLVDNPAFMTAVRETVTATMDVELPVVSAPRWTPDNSPQHGITTLHAIEKLTDRITLGGFDIVIMVSSWPVRAIEQRRAIRAVCGLVPGVFAVWFMASDEELRYFPEDMLANVVHAHAL